MSVSGSDSYALLCLSADPISLSIFVVLFVLIGSGVARVRRAPVQRHVVGPLLIQQLSNAFAAGNGRSVSVSRCQVVGKKQETALVVRVCKGSDPHKLTSRGGHVPRCPVLYIGLQ